MDWQGTSASELGRAIGRGEISPLALTEAMLAAIEAHEFGPRIYARLTRERALAEAEAAEARAKAGTRRSLLDGVPISWKDLFDTAGVATESGSRLLEGRTPTRDALVLARASAAGLVCLGKTHQTELAFSGIGLNPVTASPPCVNDHAAVSGGSSSGAATSVAFHLAAAGIGSDTGGSVRTPAAWNDLVGLKTTHGRLPLTGTVPLCASFDTIGPLTRTVEDAAELLAVMEAGRAPDLRGATLEGTRLMVLETVALDDLAGAVSAGFTSAVERLQAAGALVTRRALPLVAEAMALAGPLYAPEAYATWEAEIEAAPERMYPPVLTRFRGGRDVPARENIAAWHKLHRLRAAWAEAVAGYDAVLIPSVANLPPKQEAVLADEALFTSENLLALRNTRIGNLMGLPALTLPTGVPSTGLMLMGAPMGEERLLRLGAAAEAALS
ncbi:amidase [Vannielia litorea]|uniref:Aspartyl-tRNA(Asn)/glutamyl-tRNA(Gln) amidotransferase subunit A n=1 Tax=Vannielia litorea TaxID=1217970 RepID=A0A1N6HBJ2_9RHOB|nr:amidase family protein [Vannielia litorea]SIO17152.1 aspartyl-tRNA(Asn)/glutamyl-tRNA(Gln) amidotransferase subunit A [Vannielia litorea]